MCANVQRKMSNFVPMNARRILCNDIRSFHIRSFHIPIMRYVQIMYRVCSEKAYNILILNTRWGQRKPLSKSKKIGNLLSLHVFRIKCVVYTNIVQNQFGESV